MTSYRRSYRKTAIAASLVAAGSGALVVSLIAAAWLLRGPWGPGVWLAWGGVTVMLAAVAGWTSLVANGGLIALHRDALEAQGVPYAPGRPREWHPGPPVRALRRGLRLIRRAVRGRSASLDLRPGELVEVRSLPEILATLDERGTLDGLPFMPEMVTFCGGQFRVLRRVDKLNDWVGHTGLRRVRDTVLLEGLRCDGGHHGACQASCHVRWKEAWLQRPSIGAAGRRDPSVGVAPEGPERHGGLDERDLRRLAQRVAQPGGVCYVCQVTELAAGTTPVAWADPRHYIRDLVRGNVRLGPLLSGVSIALFNWVQQKRGGVRFPNYVVTERRASPHAVLDLQPGDLVRVKRKREIEPTLNSRSRNRGLWFDAEMLRFCGGEYRVLARVERLIEESTGKPIHLGNPCIILDGVTATGEYLGFCAQNEAIFWREIWLARS